MAFAKKILITGASGFIGTHLRNALVIASQPFDVLSHTVASWPDRLGTDLDLSKVKAVVHLAVPRICERDAWTDIEHQTIQPLSGLLSAIQRTNRECSLIFVSSQSASPTTPSKYGRMKWRSEKLIEASDCIHTIVRPGLVIGTGSSGLFPFMLKLVRLSPVIPLVGTGRQMIQPVAVSALVEALVHICSDPKSHVTELYRLALAPILFRDFLSRIATRLKKRRVFVPIPEALVDTGLWVLESILKNPPLTRVNLAGLLNLETMDTKASSVRLGIEMPTIEATIDEAIG